jgi:DNA-binding NarL/FixJ family response regulator
MDNADYITARNETHTVKPVSGSEMIRVLIVDDQPAVRKGLLMLFAAAADLRVVGEAADSQSALELAVSLCPDIILVDVEMPHMDGIATAATLHGICPQASIIILSFHDDAPTRARAEDAGAAAFVAKSMPADTLLTTIRQVSQMRCTLKKGGETYG